VISTRKFPIHDCHIHFFTQAIMERRRSHLSQLDSRLQQAAQRNHDKHMSKANNLTWEFPDGAQDAANRWLEHFDRAGVSSGVFMAPFAECDELRQFMALSERFIGLSWLDATRPDAAAILERERAAGLVGVKLYPVADGYLLSDKRCYPLFEAAARTGMFVIIHYGVTIGYNSNLAYANPLDLHVVARDFPEVSFVVAHFGAGFMREALMLAYQQENVAFDTSGSNNWLRTQPEKMSLYQVFERFLEGAGPERILFGSDSTNFPRGYRLNVLEEQLEIIEDLPITDEQRALILGGNLQRLIAANKPAGTAEGVAAGESAAPSTQAAAFS
jgi:uncharacterized protein